MEDMWDANICPAIYKENETNNTSTKTSNVTSNIMDDHSTSGNVMVVTNEHHSGGFQFNQVGHVNSSITCKCNFPILWILLDNESTLDILCNPWLQENIHKVKENILIHCTAGVTSTDMVGSLAGYGQLWYRKNRIANILSLSNVCNKGHEFIFSSNTDNRFEYKKNRMEQLEFSSNHHRDNTTLMQRVQNMMSRFLFLL